jgi:hypothetical protein
MPYVGKRPLRGNLEPRFSGFFVILGDLVALLVVTSKQL